MNNPVKDKLEIQIAPLDEQIFHNGFCDEEVRFFINGESFVESLQKQESYFAQKEGHPNIAGGYVWPRNRPETRLAFMGAGETYNRGKADLLQCECGTPGCWDLLFKIDIEPEQVIWSSFEQPHRGSDSRAGHWDYSEFGPFVFERMQYEAEVAKIAASQ